MASREEGDFGATLPLEDDLDPLLDLLPLAPEGDFLGFNLFIIS